MNDCFICGWQAPTEANLRDHLLTCHPGKENRPVVKQWEEEVPSNGIDWQAYVRAMADAREAQSRRVFEAAYSGRLYADD